MAGGLYMNDFNELIIKKRLRESSIKRPRGIDEFYSDRSRIIYSSSFRRLQQKAQVFSLEPNASVRTRLTHSIEVSDLGRTLANKIAYNLKNSNKLTDNNTQMVVAIVENACLLHDIGNPPFGHFGEAAIKDWAKNNIYNLIPNRIDRESELLKKLVKDFEEFDGNPQGFRIVTKLHTEHDKYSLNLTYSTLLSIIKYPRASGEKGDDGILKKAGYFQTEKDLVEKIFKESNLINGCRYPFVYIMEAADDIAYCMSDIADGIEKGILTEKQFLEEFKNEWKKKYELLDLPKIVNEIKEVKGFNQDISIPWSKEAMDEVVKEFVSKEENIYKGNAQSLISENLEMGKVLETMKSVSKRILYTSFEAESIEITGYAVIMGILKKYGCILKMEYDNFKKLVDGEKIKEFDFEKRLFHLIGKRYIKAYNYEKEKIKEKEEKDVFLIKEWWLRVHLILDHISGMTDEYALETYQMFEGIKLMR